MPRNISVTFFEDDEPTNQMLVPRGTSFEALRQKWREASQDQRPVIFLQKSLDGPALPEEGCLSDIFPPRKHMLAIHVLHAEERRVRVVGSHLEPITIQLFPLETAEDLIQRLKRLLGIEEERVARLLCGGRILEAEQQPCQLAGAPGLELDVELPFVASYIEPASFESILFDACDGHVLNKHLEKEGVREGTDPSRPNALPLFSKPVEVQETRLFASQTARALTGVGQCRVTALRTGVRIADNESVSKLVSEEALLNEAVTGVVVERRMEVRVEEKLWRRSRTESVWPTEKLTTLVRNANDVLLIEGERVDPEQSFWEAGLQAGSTVCVTRFLTVSVFDEKGAIRKTTVDLGESLLDLRTRLSFPEEDFELWLDEKLIKDDERSLAELEIDATSLLKALPRSRAVALKVRKAEPVSMGNVKKTTTFHAFLNSASEALKTKLPGNTRFVCSCGRVFSSESAERREFPLQCCSASELRFSVVQPAKSECRVALNPSRESCD